MEKTTSRDCVICRGEIPKKGFVSLDCGCLFHLACRELHRNVTSQCPKCFPLNISALGNLELKNVKQNPISFGDDYTVDLLVSKRVEMLSGMDKIKPNDYVSLDTLRQSLQYNSKPIGTAVGTLKSAWSYVIDSATGDETLKSQIDQMSVMELITNRMPVVWLSKKGVDGKSLYSNGVTIDMLFKFNYTLEDFVILRVTWNDMLNMGFRNYEVFKRIKQTIDIRYLCNVWTLNHEHIIRGVCGNKMKKFAKLEFNKSDLKLLGFTFDVFNKLTPNKRYLIYFTGVSLTDWMELGLNQILLEEYKYTSSDILECFRVSKEVFEKKLGIDISYYDTISNQTVIHKRNNNFTNNIDPYYDEISEEVRGFSIGEDEDEDD